MEKELVREQREQQAKREVEEFARKLAAEQAEREKAEREVKEKAEREAAEKAAREKLELEAIEKTKREKAEQQAVEKAACEAKEKNASQRTPKPEVKKNRKANYFCSCYCKNLKEEPKKEIAKPFTKLLSPSALYPNKTEHPQGRGHNVRENLCPIIMFVGSALAAGLFSSLYYL